ncbi:TerB family tellurite resistance protein [Jannaschia seohaensis]|uniref:Co-chaperone DjlA N-terminal domain-containing protein n=1 Tax=Jannaschia seohaensis TaxID=475081 RepID=A0A2Y9A8K8_9RHOB|nr:TerB family tellurite resistance protein [Jannaschia seohaensis]PWJ22249.1 hypothetical protein BCF38_101659 [Jannaschia seohaensis]SSA38527.1 hypothetical protein SAMN05421539_101659 [Jannaschia seohaensis]
MMQTNPFAAMAAALLLLPTSPAPTLLSDRVTTELREVVHLSEVPDLSLCRVVETRRIGLVPYRRAALGYALSDTRCEGGQSWALTVPVATLRAEGHVEAWVPDAPRLSLGETVRGHLGLLALLAVCLASVGLAVMRWRIRLVRMEILGLRDGPVFRMIDAMCHAAAASDRSGPDAVEHIRDLACELTGMDYTTAHIEAVIARADRLQKAGDHHRFGVGLSARQKTMLLEGVLSVVMADGRLSMAESRFCADLARGLGLARAEAWAARSRVLRRRAGVAPA